jgi:hypothetical protein
MEIAKPIMAAEVLALRVPSVPIAAPTGAFPPEDFNPSREPAVEVGTCLTFCVNVRFKNDLLMCDEHLTVPEWFFTSQ